ncbi:MAG: tryptophan 7-halogenase [Pseudomonadota bacterium]
MDRNGGRVDQALSGTRPDILIVGGAGGVSITRIESSDIPTIGVGEGTFPTIVRALARQEFARVRDAARRAVAALSPRRELLARLYQAGFSFSANAEHLGASRL